MKNNSLVITIIAVIVVGALAFFGGMQYQKMQRSTPAGMSLQSRGANGQTGQAGRRFGGASGATPVRGEIINSDAKSITVKMQDGSSKIVLLSSTTAISQAAQASATDLQTGKQVMVFGTLNSDGSVTAQNIQLNPQQMRPGGAT